MKHTRAALFAGLTLTAASVGAFVPAHAAVTDDTEVTFTITSNGGLSVTAPQTGTLADLNINGTVVPTTTSGTLNEVEVNDTRGALAAAWTVTVSAEDFVNQTDTTKKIGASNLAYAATPTPELGAGIPVFVPGAFGVADELLLPKVTFAGVGNNRSSWTPGLTLTVPATAPVGEYKSTITHSVA